VGFHEQLTRSKWRSLPVVLFSNTSAQPRVNSIKETRESASHHSDIYRILICALRFRRS
jgi:hypothetical protein